MKEKEIIKSNINTKVVKIIIVIVCFVGWIFLFSDNLVSDDINTVRLSWAGFLLSSLVCIVYIKLVYDPVGLTVTNKRVYGKSAFGKRVDLPLDSISSIGIMSLFKGVSIATSSGKVSFPFLKNHKDIYNAISELLVERQNNKFAVENYDYIEELKKLKELMNEGIITQEEFDKKKTELLK